MDWESSEIHVRSRWIRAISTNRSRRNRRLWLRWHRCWRSIFAAWHEETASAKATDWVFASAKTHVRTPRVGNMLCVDYLRPTAIEARVELDKGQRFGFHSLRHSLSSFLVTKKKTDVKTAQRSMRHAKSSTMLNRYAQTDMDELIAS
ncbi:MAG: tyrosine-type recombinase/integrase [Candidatus Sulfotelmatobacter sp.]